MPGERREEFERPPSGFFTSQGGLQGGGLDLDFLEQIRGGERLFSPGDRYRTRLFP